MSKNEILWILSGDTTVMYELLAEVPELNTMAQKVSDNKAKYNELLTLAYEFF